MRISGKWPRAFDMPYARVMNVADFKTAYASFVGRPGMSVLEVDVPLAGLRNGTRPISRELHDVGWIARFVVREGEAAWANASMLKAAFIAR